MAKKYFKIQCVDVTKYSYIVEANTKEEAEQIIKDLNVVTDEGEVPDPINGFAYSDQYVGTSIVGSKEVSLEKAVKIIGNNGYGYDVANIKDSGFIVYRDVDEQATSVLKYPSSVSETKVVSDGKM